MKSQYYKVLCIRNLLATFMMVSSFSSCVKNDKLYTPEEGVCYMPQAYQDKGVLYLLKADSVQSATFGFYYTGFNGAPTDITGTFTVDTTLVVQYNTQHAYTGKVYQVLPSSSYTISSINTVVSKGKTTSVPLSLLINPKSLAVGVKYMLPVELASVSSGNINTNLSVTYFRIDTLR